MPDQEQPAPGGMVHYAHEPTGCDAWIPGVPKSVSRARMIQLIESLGIDPRRTRSLRFQREAIYVEVYALKDGNPYWDGGPTEEAATHRIAIAIEDRVVEHEDRGDNPEPQPA
ncbi:MAG TPA: hypothetical protein VFV66_37660 [Nonomuraea sp.]|nr:hypothetical protein [Nonomuraea sp.]